MTAPPEPEQTRLDLRLRLPGAAVRITPLFWAASALLGVRYYTDPEEGNPGWFLFWMAATLFSVLLHQFGQVFAARLFGVRGHVALSGLGGITFGLEALGRWRRILVLLAGPATVAVVLALGWGLTALPYPELIGKARAEVGTGVRLLALIATFWAALNLLPLWPLSGGRVACEIGEGLFGRWGINAALLLSILTAGLLAIWRILQLAQDLDVYRFDPRYRAFLTQNVILILFCFAFWLQGFRALWPQQGQPAA